MVKKFITLPALAALLLTGAVTQTSCSRTEKAEVAQDSEQAYSDFRTFVTNAEINAGMVGDKTEQQWNQETTQLKADYDARVAAAEAGMSGWDEARRTEYDQLKTRYTTAYDKRSAAWSSRTGATAASGTPSKLGKYYKPSSPAAQITAANARTTYEAFVNNIKANENQYDIDDWRNINAEWRALDEAYDKVKGDISANDLAEIQKEKLKYAAFKSYDKAEARTSQGADAVSGAAKEVSAETADERSKVGQAASNTASDVKDAGKTVGQKIGNAAKKVGEKTKEGYKEVKSEVKNTDND